MKNIFLICSFIFFSPIAVGQISPTIETAQFETICLDKSQLETTLETFGEIPLMQGRSARYIGDKKYDHSTIFFMNPKTRTWTVVEKIDDFYCIISLGSRLEPALTTTKKPFTN